MSDVLRIREVRIHRLAIPMRLRFDHAAAQRAVADPIVIELRAETPFATLVGFGETLARPYVTGETPDTVEEDILSLFCDHLVEMRVSSFAGAVAFADALPAMVEGRLLHAARCAVELAVLDLAGVAFKTRLVDADALRSIGAANGSCAIESASVSAIVVGKSRTKRNIVLRAARCFGLRDFKAKVAVDGWQERLKSTFAHLRPLIERSQATLRVDANGGWTPEEAHEHAPLLRACGVCAVEQPMDRRHDEQLPDLRRESGLSIIADESMRTPEEAARLIDTGGADILNVRLAKNGGLIPSLRIAADARQRGADVQLGCLVGQTSVLSAAERAFLGLTHRVRFCESAYGPLLLKGDVVKKPLRFGVGGRLVPLRRPGLGVVVDPARLEALSERPSVNVPF